MDIKLSLLSAARVKLLTLATLGGISMMQPVSAQEFLCDATQASAQELPLLSASCPIGQGLWGKQQPKGDESTFWIQCGVLSKPLSVKEAKLIYPHISTDVWAKIEGKNARCLIGPYQNFSEASKDLLAVKKLKPYQQAFIREVVKGAPPQSKVLPPQPKPKANAQPLPVKTAATRQSTTILPPAKVTKPAEIKAAPVAAKPVPVEMEISVRREIRVGDLHFKVPYLPFSDDQFYMEYDKPWSRVDFAKATKVCHALDMEVPSPAEWQTLLEADVMKSHQWPMHLPYWGSDNAALFTSGKVTITSGKSLLNVMCVG
ncbi:SPOR domain-containing protein [Vibrio rhodolitus]|uniref:SPOR domain-containing protein n=1 Tax=Vibrio rhodolitus TaxID=2231649 RepID=UPI000E0B798C|nr:SPOR domain-containing protein [Vibrio rhodolitus]